MIRQAGSVVQKLVNRDCVRVGQRVKPGAIPEVGGQEIAARQLPFALQRQNRRRHKGLADACREHRSIGSHAAAVLNIRKAGCRGHDRSVGQHYRSRCSWKGVTVEKVTQDRLQLQRKIGPILCQRGRCGIG